MAESTDRLSTALADRYRIERRLGEGGMATVYLAEDLKHDRKVAVKVLRPELAAVLGADRFVQEIKTTANLQHPHILPLFDSGRAAEFLYYVMPFIDGETLRNKLDRETQLGIDEAVKIAIEIADALDYAHRHNVIHRDIKPENILLHDGRPMVADFGIALAVSAAAGGRMTETGLSLGTPHYMSPEQATAEKDLTNRSDIYSLGCVLYEMLTGDPPHTGSSAQQVVMRIVTDEARPVTELRKSVPPHVAAATAKAIEKLAADRFENAAKFGEALANPAFTLPGTLAVPVTGRTAGGLWNRLSLAMTVVAALALILAGWGWLRQEPKPIRRYRLGLPEDQALQPVFGTRLALSPDGSRLVYVGPGEHGGQLWLRERDRLDATPLPGTEGGTQPFFSPDGRRVGFLTVAPFAIKVVSLDGGPPITIADSGLSGGGGVWGPDDYVYNGGYIPITRVAAAGGSVPEAVTTLDTARGEVGHAYPQVLHNGQGALFMIGHGTGITNIGVVDFATGEHQVLMEGTGARYAASGHLVYVTADGTLMAAPFDQDRLALTGPAVALAEGVWVGPLSTVDLTISATGTLMYTRGGAAASDELVWVKRDGSTEAIDPGWTGNFETVALSPDEARLALTIASAGGSSDLWIKQLDRGPLSKLTFEAGRNYRPVWTPDGRGVVFVSSRGGDFNLLVKRADGSAGAEVLLNAERPVNEGVLSHDGHWFVYRVGSGTELDILGIRPGVDSVPVELVATPFDESAPSLSPDDRWLAYVSDESDRPEVYVRPFPNTGDAKWQVSTNGGTEPLWAHSGRELFYRSGTGDLVAVEILTQPTFSVGEQRALFSAVPFRADIYHRAYDVTSDDQRFVMIRPRGGAGSNAIVVVENFFEELKARVGRE